MAFFGSGTQQKSVFGGSGFGGISPASSSAFGQPAAGGFGGSAFGAQTASAFGSTFGQSSAALGGLGTPAAGGLFGSPQPQPQGGLFAGAAGGGFGSFSQPTSAFGAAPTTPGFGAAQPQAAGVANAMQQQPAGPHPQLGYPTNGQGSRVAPFQPESAKQNDGTIQQFRSISGMPAYINKSHEELRLEDYSNNCKGNAGAQPYPVVHPSKVAASGAAGTPGFGSPGATGFGAGNGTFGTFGATASAFGATTSAFGAPAQGGSLFGQPASQASVFGAQPAAQSSLFGNTSPSFGGSTFGQPASQASAFGFSQPAQTSLFGTPAASSASLFGSQQAGTFGQKPAATGLFGAPAQPSPGLFGAPAQSSQSLFAAPAASSTSLFNQPAGAAPFGTPIKPTGFGATGATPVGQQPVQPGVGLFGQASSSSLFGTPASSSLFGQQSSSPLFGGAASGGLFGNTGAGAFGQKPATPAGGGLFGNTGASLFSPQSSASLFGTGAAIGGGSLFGPPASSASLFGAASSASLFGAPAQPAAGSPFGSMLGQPAAGAATALAPPIAPAAAGQSPYGALPSVPVLPDIKSGIAASPVNRSVKVPPPVVFRPRPRAVTPLRSPMRSPRTSQAPGANDTQRHLASKSPSIFKISYRDPGLIINGPLPSTAAGTSPPAAAPGQTAASPGASPSTAAPAGPSSAAREQLVTPEIQPIGAARPGTRSSPASVPHERASVATPPPLHGLSGATSADEQASRLSHSVRIPDVPDGWFMKPSPEDLRAKVSRDPDSIKAIDRFTVGKEGVGKIMFLEDVDLSGVKILSDVFSIEDGHVTAYMKGGTSKPPLGQGCNQPARVQINLPIKRLNRIIKRDDCKSSEEHISKVKIALQRLNAEVKSTFVSMKVIDSTSVVWTFEVPHWSRYGLPPELCGSASEDSDTEAGTGRLLPRSTVARPRGIQSILVSPDFTAAPADSYKLDSEDNVSDGTDMHEVDSQPVTPLPQAHTVFQPLQPLYERSSVAAAPLASPLSAEQAMATPPSARMSPPDAHAPQTAWAAPTRPLQVQRPIPPGGLPAVPMLAHSEALDSVTGAACVPASDGSTVTDMWPLMCRARRAHISPHGHIATCTHTISGTQIRSTVKLARLLPGAVLLAEGSGCSEAACTGVQDVMRERAQRLLEVHSQYSSAVSGHAEGIADVASPGSADMDVDSAVAIGATVACEPQPHLSFQCQADSMPCVAMKDACSHGRWLNEESQLRAVIAAHAPSLDEAARSLAATFALILRLFGALDPADGSCDVSSDDVGALVAVQRKLEVSEWLEEQVDREVLQALPQAEQSTDGKQAVVAELLSAHDIPTAVHVAASAGLPRLATLLAGAGLFPHSSGLLAHQISDPSGLPSWTTFGLFHDPQRRLMPPALEAAYKLLAGDVPAALAFLRARHVSWHRVFGMCLWYGITPDQPLSSAILRFSRMLSAAPLSSDSRPPFPGPWYGIMPLRTSPGLPSQAVDAQYVLLHLAAREPLMLASPPASLALQLACTGGYSPDPLDSLVPWLVCGILMAVGKLEDDCGEDRKLAEVYAQLTVDCAATLVWLGECRWALYVLCHLPATDDALNDSKAGLLQHVLDIHRITRTTTESLEADAEWLAETCRMPLHLISRADALAAQATFSTNARADALTTAQLQDDAHTFMSHVAGPQHLSRMQSPRLGAWLMTCPTLQNQDALAIKAFLDLQERIEARAEAGQDEFVHNSDERQAAYTVLLHACARLSELKSWGKEDQEQQVMFSHVATVVGKWMLAGPRGTVSITNHSGQNLMLEQIPSSVRNLHEVLGRA